MLINNCKEQVNYNKITVACNKMKLQIPKGIGLWDENVSHEKLSYFFPIPQIIELISILKIIFMG